MKTNKIKVNKKDFKEYEEWLKNYFGKIPSLVSKFKTLNEYFEFMENEEKALKRKAIIKMLKMSNEGRLKHTDYITTSEGKKIPWRTTISM